MGREATGTVLHVAPHPDDELLGAPATLMALRDAGWRVVNLACGLGRRATRRAPREAELREACRLAGFELRLGAKGALADSLRHSLEELRPAIVVSPGPHELHPAHRLVATALREVLESTGAQTPRWWMWALWGSLRQPTLATGFDSDRLAEILTGLGAHRGELERNDYRRLVEGRAAMNAVLAPELLFGLGTTPGDGARYAELLTEAVATAAGWRLGTRRWLKPTIPIAPIRDEEALVT